MARLATLTAAALATLLSAAGPAQAESFRVASQNIWLGMTQIRHRTGPTSLSCFDEDRRTCEPLCAASSRGLVVDHLLSVVGTGPTLVGLQEVHTNSKASCEVDQPRWLAQRLGSGWQGIFGKARNHHGGEYGNAILHNQRTVWQTSHRYSKRGSETRAIAMALVEFGTGKRLLFASTHLDHREPQLALEQAAEAKDWVAGLAAWYSVPAILVGDFNLGRGQSCSGFADCQAALVDLMTGDDEFDEVTDDVVSSSMRFGSTGATAGPKLDYIFVFDPRGDLEVKARHVVHYGARGVAMVTPIASQSLLPCAGDWCAADHHTVVADFRFR